MAKKNPAFLLDFFSKHRIVMLLAVILGMIIGSPFLDDIFQYEVIPDIFITIIFVFGIFAVSRKKLHIYIALALAIPMYTGIWSSHLFQSPKSLVVGHLFGTFLIGFVIGVLVNFIFNEKEITKEVIFAAVVVYLLFGIMWSLAYSILDYFYPNSFSFPGNISPNEYRYLYFSYVTLTTLGYGDVAPLTNKAGSLVILEAIIGQIYLVVIVAWLVGMHVSRSSR